MEIKRGKVYKMIITKRDGNQVGQGIQDDNNQTCDGNQSGQGIQDDNNQTCYGNQVLTSNRNTSRKRKLPVTRSNDFLW